MLKFFRSNQPFIALIIPLIIAVLLLPILKLEPEEFLHISLPDHPFFNNIWTLYFSTTIAVSIAATMCNRFLINSNLHLVKNYLPAIIYGTFTSVQIVQSGLYWPVFSNIPLVLSLLYFFGYFNKRIVLNAFFRSGFWLGVAALMSPSLNILIFAYFFILILNRQFNLREWIVLCVGLIFPMIYFLSALFFLEIPIDQIVFIDTNITSYFLDSFNSNLYERLFVLLTLISISTGLIYYFKSYSTNVKKTLVSRNSFVFILMVFALIFALELNIYDQSVGFVSVAVPASCLISFVFFDDDSSDLVNWFFAIIMLLLLALWLLSGEIISINLF